MADISKITLPNGDSYDIKDNGAVRINDGTLTGTTTAESLLSDEVVAGSLIVNGDARFVNTINGDISGNAATATKAVQDGNGSTITSTYMKLSGTNTNSATNTFSGSNTFSNKAFYYTGIENGTTDAARVVWFADASYKGKPVYNESFKYNPSTNVLTVGSITGSAASATKATQDGSGNTITSYYCTLSTAQTISGVKTFSAMPIAKAGVRVSNTGNTEGCDFVYDDTTQSVLMSFH